MFLLGLSRLVFSASFAIAIEDLLEFLAASCS